MHDSVTARFGGSDLTFKIDRQYLPLFGPPGKRKRRVGAVKSDWSLPTGDEEERYRWS